MVACGQARRVSDRDALKMMLALEDRLTWPFASAGQDDKSGVGVAVTTRSF